MDLSGLDVIRTGVDNRIVWQNTKCILEAAAFVWHAVGQLDVYHSAWKNCYQNNGVAVPDRMPDPIWHAADGGLPDV